MEEFKFTEESFEKFKSLYKESNEKQLESFNFEEHEVLTLYAKYVIEYIEYQTKTKN
jgi:hypothetical protein